MKATLNKNRTVTLSGLTVNEWNAIKVILHAANDRCFDEQEEDGDWFSNDDFMVTLNNKEREALRKVCEVI